MTPLLASLALGSCLARGSRYFTVVYALALDAGNRASPAFSGQRLVLAIAGLLLVAAAVLATEGLIRSRHSRALEREARALGLTFSVAAKPFAGSNVHGLTLLQGDSSAVAENVVQTSVDGRQALVFELPTGEGEMASRHFTTVAAFRCPGGEMPEFEIGRKSVVSRLGEGLRRPPAVIEDREFSKEFFVRCREPKKVHDWLTPAKLAELRTPAAPFHISANADWILIFRPGARISAAQFPAFLRETARITAALLQ